MIALTIDGTPVSAPKGASILETALANGIFIPHLCYDPRLERHGGCRMCLVEVEGQPRPFAACSTPVDQGMRVLTHTPQVNKLRQTALELMLASHPLDCPVCDKAGECVLQDLAFTYGSTRGRFKSPRNNAPHHENPLIDTNTNRCILCGKCVRICWEQQGVGALNFQHRGASTIVATAFNETLNCEFCGQCMDVCPVGALTPRPSKHRSRVWFMETNQAVCPFCSVGCSLDLDIHDQNIIRSRGRNPSRTTKGNLCAKGRYGYDFIYTDDRLTTPLVRREGMLQRASWEEALGYVADSLRWITEKKGAKRIGAIASPRFSNEDNYMLQKFMRQVLGSQNIDSIARFGHAKFQEAIEEVFGLISLPVEQTAPLGAGVAMVVESPIDATHPVWSLNFLRAKRQGTKLIVVEPRKTKLAVHADRWLAVNPATSEALLKGFIHLALAQGTYRKKEAPSIPGFDELAASVESFTPSSVASLTGLSEKDVREAAALFLGAPSRVIAMTLGAHENDKGKNTVLAAANLLMLTGDGPRGLQIPTEYCNSFGMWKVGATPDRLPGFRKITPGGLNAYQMLYEPDRISALIVMGENPVVNFPDAARVKQTVSGLDLLVVQDMRLTETAKLAHVVLPAAVWVEADGTYVNAADIPQMTKKVLVPPGEARPAWQVLNELARLFDHGFGKNDLRSLREEASEIETDPYADFPRFVPVGYRRSETADDEYPILMVTTSIMQHSGTLSLSSRNLRKVKPEGFVEIGPEDAARYGIENNRFVTVTSRRGSMVIKAHISDDIRPGNAYIPVHFSLTNPNNLTGITHDGATPVCAVRIEPIREGR